MLYYYYNRRIISSEQDLAHLESHNDLAWKRVEQFDNFPFKNQQASAIFNQIVYSTCEEKIISLYANLKLKLRKLTSDLEWSSNGIWLDCSWWSFVIGLIAATCALFYLIILLLMYLFVTCEMASGFATVVCHLLLSLVVAFFFCFSSMYCEKYALNLRADCGMRTRELEWKLEKVEREFKELRQWIWAQCRN